MDRLTPGGLDFGLFSEPAEPSPIQSAYMIEAKASRLYAKRSPAQVGAVTPEQASAALRTDAVARRILAKGIAIENGQLVGARLNLNVMRSTGVAVNTIHRGPSKGDGYTKNRGLWGGEVIGYEPTVTLRSAYFNVHQPMREKIARGEAKGPMASIDGHYVLTADHDFSGVEVRFNPQREHLFRDGLGRVLRWAEEVTIVGKRAFARGRLEYYGPHNAPARAGDAPTQGRLLAPGDNSGDCLF